jgi:MoaA/NifB/PqqE/SkfB family radical SAM enzyme
VVLATNGLLLGRYSEQINNSCITNITVSIDAMEKHNDEIRGVKGYFKKTLGNLLHIKNKKIKIVSVLSNVLVEDLEELITLCRDRGYTYDVNLPDNNMYFFASQEVEESIKKLKPSADELNKLFKILAKNDILTGVILENAKNYMFNGNFLFSHCMQGFIEINIDSKGNVRTGCNVFEPVGNIMEKKVSEIVNSRAYLNSVKKMYAFDCPGCTCGYGISAIYSAPFSTSLSYIKKRIT